MGRSGDCEGGEEDGVFNGFLESGGVHKEGEQRSVFPPFRALGVSF